MRVNSFFRRQLVQCCTRWVSVCNGGDGEERQNKRSLSDKKCFYVSLKGLLWVAFCVLKPVFITLFSNTWHNQHFVLLSCRFDRKVLMVLNPR